MKRTSHTTRKGFFKGVGLAIAGAFALPGSSKAATGRRDETPPATDLAAMSRVRPAKGAVERGA